MSKAHLNQVIASHLVEIKADQKPDQEIYVFERGEHGEDILTYQTLYENSNKLARLLLDNGVGKGDSFAVFMRNYPEFAYGLLAGTTIGAVMVPVDPRSRGDRLKFLLNNSKAKAVIASAECLEALQEVRADIPEVKYIAVAYQRDLDIPVNPDFPVLNEAIEKDSWDHVDQQIMDVRHPMQIIYTPAPRAIPRAS
jgi:acyl-coenzyme A synthetase/AMP-(fatty) acid ligase